MNNSRHAWEQGKKQALKGLEPDNRKRTPYHAKYYKQGYEHGKKLFQQLAMHGMLQKIGDAYTRE